VASHPGTGRYLKYHPPPVSRPLDAAARRSIAAPRPSMATSPHDPGSFVPLHLARSKGDQTTTRTQQGKTEAHLLCFMPHAVAGRGAAAFRPYLASISLRPLCYAVSARHHKRSQRSSRPRRHALLAGATPARRVVNRLLVAADSTNMYGRARTTAPASRCFPQATEPPRPPASCRAP